MSGPSSSSDSTLVMVLDQLSPTGPIRVELSDYIAFSLDLDLSLEDLTDEHREEWQTVRSFETSLARQ